MKTIAILILPVLALGALAAEPAMTTDDLVSQAAAIGLDACTTGSTSVATPPVVEFVSCSGELSTFDGLELDARLTFPAGARGPLPTVLLLHGWPGDRRGWQRSEERTDVLGRGRFLAEGFATLATTARGFWASCGVGDQAADANASGSSGPLEEDPAGCIRGWTHIAERDFEVRDSQHALGQLVDVGFADPGRLAVLGDSYGGGQAWLLATSGPWDSPDGSPVRLAAAVARQGWTDLLNALAPNGRPDPALADAPGRSGSVQPLGVLKQTTFSALWAAGRGQTGSLPGYPQGPVEAFARYNTVDPTETHSFIDGWMAVFQAGEPYSPDVAEFMHEALAGKSAYHAESYLEAVAAGEVEPTPVMALQGWTDPLFTPAETLRMYDRLRAAVPDYPVSIAFADGGHFSLPRTEQWAMMDELGAQFVVAHLTGDGSAPSQVTSLRVSCPDEAPAEPLVADDWNRFARESIILTAPGSGTTSSLPADPELEVALDPVANGRRTCATLDRAPQGSALWDWPVPKGGIETIGLQRVQVDYAIDGVDATLVARLWEVDEAGRRTLVTSGVRRLSLAGGDPAAGTVEVELFGTHWRFEPGRTIELELSQTDAPYLRPDALPSRTTLSSPRLVLPVPTPACAERPGRRPVPCGGGSGRCGPRCG